MAAQEWALTGERTCSATPRPEQRFHLRCVMGTHWSAALAGNAVPRTWETDIITGDNHKIHGMLVFSLTNRA